MRRRLVLFPILIALAVMAFQYFGAETFENPETGERHKVRLSLEQEEALGLSAYREVLQTSNVVERGPDFELVKRVAERLAGATGELGSSFDWRVSVVDSPDVNAFCLPGGKIVVYTGILPVAQSEAGLATVMGHEMAHATARHGAQRMFQQEMTQIALMGAQGSLGDLDPAARRQLMGVLGAGAQVGVLLPFSRDHETEADEVGLRYMARAGYDPRESVKFWERMAEQSQGGAQPEFLSTHPAHASRIAALKAYLPRALEEYRPR